MEIKIIDKETGKKTNHSGSNLCPFQTAHPE